MGRRTGVARTFTRGPGRELIRALAAAAVVAVLLLPGVASAAAPTHLSNPKVTPSSGTTSTRITFQVTFRSSNGRPADQVTVQVGSRSYVMQPASSAEDWKTGGQYTLTSRLAAGTWKVSFQASGSHFNETLPGPALTIAAPKPKPAPKPSPTPEPRATPKPTPRPTSTPVLSPTVVPVPHSVFLPGTDPTVAPPASPSPTAGQAPHGAVIVPGLTTPTGTNGGGGSTAGGNPAGGAGAGAGGAGGASAIVPGPSGPFGDGSPGASLGGPVSLPALLAAVLPTAVTTTGGVAMTMAFLVFGKRRRDEAPTAPDDVLAAASAMGSGVVANRRLVESVVMSRADEARHAVLAAIGGTSNAVDGTGPQVTDDLEAHLPRWRRPSLMQARKADPLRTAESNVRLTFQGDVGDALDGMERRYVRYRLVSLLDAPDEVRGSEIGVLDEGDEVVLLEKRGTYWRVLCPDGQEGWLHKMTLGDTVIEPAGTGGRGSWTSGDDGPRTGGFEDVLRAYTERRRQFGEAS